MEPGSRALGLLGTLSSSLMAWSAPYRDDERRQCDDVAHHRADGGHDVRPFHAHLLSVDITIITKYVK